MKNIIFALIILLFFCFASCSKQYHSFTHLNTERTYILHQPPNLPSHAPLVFALHGYGNQAHFIQFYSRMNKVADKYGFVVCYPQGSLDEKGKTHWNAQLTISETDDIGFLTALATHLQTAYQLDSNKTFSFGVSNGGFMSYALAHEAPEKFKAIASIIGTMSKATWKKTKINPQPTAILQISGLKDKIVPIDGSMSPNGGWGGAPPMDTIMNYWGHINDCKTIDTVQISDKTTAYYYKNGVDNKEVWYYKCADLPHTWPSKKRTGIKTSETIWKFFNEF